MLLAGRTPAFYILLAVLVTGTVSANSDQGHRTGLTHRQHAAHVHGISKLNLVLEGREIHVELDSPAANIVGFERAPSSDAERAALNSAVTDLKSGERRFRFTSAAQCHMAGVDIVSGLLELDHQDHDRIHADINAHYRFECKKPERLKGVKVDLFDIFPATERLDVQYVIGERQDSATLTGNKPGMTF